MPNLTLVKLGGAVITNKEIPNQVRAEHLHRLVAELATVWQDRGERRFIIGNGAGSFGHVPASRYRTKEGFIDDESRIGMAITQNSAAWINRILVKACIEADLPALTWAASNTIVTTDQERSSFFLDALESYLDHDLLPVTHGDVLPDTKQGCTVWSTDRIFTFLAQELHRHGYQIDRIIHVTEAEGVWRMEDGDWVQAGEHREIYDHITPDMREQVRSSMVAVKGFDVTGGMWHKIEEALELTKLGISTQIISGLIPQNLTSALTGDQPRGTLITA